MNETFKIIIGIILPLVGTTLGAGMVFFLKKDINSSFQKFFLGFAGGVMVAASVWSLIIPAVEMTEGKIAFLPVLIGFLVGVFFLLLLDTLIPHLHLNTDKPEGKKSKFGKSMMLIIAVTLHNLPEGMAVGVIFAGVIAGNAGVSVEAALILALGIAIQNFPEGAIISMPLKGNGLSRRRAFTYGFLSGVVEPIGALATIALTSLFTPVLPYILAFAAGAMIYVVVEELVPEAQADDHSNLGTIGFAVGFALMMVLDIALG